MPFPDQLYFLYLPQQYQSQWAAMLDSLLQSKAQREAVTQVLLHFVGEQLRRSGVEVRGGSGQPPPPVRILAQPICQEQNCKDSA